MRKILTLGLLCIFTTTFSQVKKHTVSATLYNNIDLQNSVHLDFQNPEINIWTQNDRNFSYGFNYTYNLTEYTGVGAQLEIEGIEFKDHYYYFNGFESRKLGYGLHVETSYPKTALHGTAGAKFNYLKISSDIFDDQVNGVECGFYLGPEFSIANFNISILLLEQLSYFDSKEDSSADGLIMDISGTLVYPKVAVRFGYSF